MIQDPPSLRLIVPSVESLAENAVVMFKFTRLGFAIGGVTVAGVTLPTRGTRFYTHGPVAAVHAAWEERCDACHEPFKPVNGNTWLVERFESQWVDGMREALQTEGPVVVDIRVTREENTYPMIPASQPARNMVG